MKVPFFFKAVNRFMRPIKEKALKFCDSVWLNLANEYTSHGSFCFVLFLSNHLIYFSWICIHNPLSACLT